MKEKFLKLLAEKEARKAEITKSCDTINDVGELRKLNDEMSKLNEEIRDLNEMIKAISDEPQAEPQERKAEPAQALRTQAVNGEIPAVVSAPLGQQEARKSNEVLSKIEQIGQELRDGKSVAISGDIIKYLEQRAITTTGVLLENKYKREIAENFNEVAQTIDLVDAFALDGGNSYDVAFQITDGEGDYTAEGATFTNDEGTFGTASTGRAKITNSAIVTDEVANLPNADYLTRIVNSVTKSIRKKISNQIIAGAGGANQLKGIYNAPTGTVPSTYVVEETAIDGDTLRNIVFAYGGDEDITSPATLFLSKLDLAAFAAVKATDGRPYYKIEYSGASGYIQESEDGLRVPYTINSACNSLSASATEAGTKTMVYGVPTNYEMPIFSNLTIKRSDERYIDQGKIGFFGSIIVGGVVNKYKGFIPVVKKS